MRINCPHCQSKATVTHREKLSPRASNVYINCNNHKCGARSVIRISHAYTITPPAETMTAAMHEWFANLPEQEQIAKTYQPALF
ncbi:MAG: ogr/Delta-like zinc finger family protein [Victivallaceae bacterium]|nr:ogr/Delta-like zinc finger family protein [Victivallaceae bacterium]